VITANLDFRQGAYQNPTRFSRSRQSVRAMRRKNAGIMEGGSSG